MVDGGHDKAGVGQCFLDVIMPAEPTASAVRDNDQRQLCARDRTVLHALKRIDKLHRKTAERHTLWLSGAWIPNGACQAGVGIEKLNACGPHGRAQTTEYDSLSPIRLEYQISP